MSTPANTDPTTDPNWKPLLAPIAHEILAAQSKAHPLRVDPNWTAVGPDAKTIRAKYPDPLRTLSAAEVPAFVLRGAYPTSDCQALIQRFISRGLMPAPEDPSVASKPRERIDIGTSLGNRGHEKEAFLKHAVGTLELYKTLFDGFRDPVKTLYQCLSDLAVGKKVVVAHETDGRQYGPAIFRIHYGDHAYPPHFDHVRLREKRTNYAVGRYQNQFAGLLCLQNDNPAGGSTQSIIHRYLWTPEVQPFLAAGTFPTFASEHNVVSCRVELNPGDVYFFNTGCIHEVPALQGKAPRIVLATFIGYSPDDDEVSVWS